IKGVAVDNERPSLTHVRQVGLEGCRVHGHQYVRIVTGGQDVVVGDVDLEGGDAGQGSRRGADLRREVRQGGEVVAEDGGGGSEAVTRELHAVAGVPGEANDRPVQLHGGAFTSSGISHISPFEI